MIAPKLKEVSFHFFWANFSILKKIFCLQMERCVKRDKTPRTINCQSFFAIEYFYSEESLTTPALMVPTVAWTGHLSIF